MIEEYLHKCLYFTSSKLFRIINRMAEEEFRITGLTPTYAFMLMIINEKPGISQKELCRSLHIAQSTGTRFIDKLEVKDLAERKVEGKKSLVYPKEKGILLQKEIEKAWKRLYERYSHILGYEEGEGLTNLVDEAGEKLEWAD